MKTVSIKEANSRLSELIREAEKGETITLTRNGTPVAEIKPVEKKSYAIDWEAGERYLREHGIKRRKGWIAADFDDPLPEDFLITPLPEDFDKPKRRRKK